MPAAPTLCPHLERCAGCPAMHLDYPEQLETKRRALGAALGRHLALAALEAPKLAPASPTLGYRRRLKWLVGPQGELGMLARGDAHEVVDTPGCLVASPTLLRVAAVIRVELARDRARSAAVTAVDLREADADAGPRVLVALVVRGRARDEAGLAGLAAAIAAAAPEVAGVALERLPERGPRHFGGRIEPLWGAVELEERAGDALLLATHGSFVQAHAGQARALASRIARLAAELGPRPRVLELFAGSGALGLALAARGAEVCFVEAHAPALERAVRAGEREGLDVRGHAGDADRFVSAARARGERFDLVLVDPPRRGLGPELRRGLADLGPKRLAYVSCHPETLARDLAHFATLGLGVVGLEAFDMIPQTDEVETLALLGPRPRPSLRVVHRDAALAVLDLGPFGSTSEVEALAKDDLGWPEARLVLPLPSSASGLAVVARDDERERALSSELRLEATVLAKSVPRAKGRVARPVGRARDAVTTYRRVAVASGHALCTLECRPASLGVAFAHLASIGHPVVGDPRACDAPTSAHFFEKHGLDRAFAHVSRLTLPGGATLESSLPGDLRAVAVSLGLALA